MESPARSVLRPSRRGAWLVGAVLVAIAAAVLWEQVLEDRFIPKRFGAVIPGVLYRSGQISRHLIDDVLTEHHIGAIVDMQGIDPDSPDQQAEIETAKRRNVELVRCPLRGDGTGDIHSYAQAVAAIDRCQRAGTPVLVHCAAGAQRTGGAVAAYQMLVRGESPETVYAGMKAYGWKPGHDETLVRYLNEHMAELARLLAEEGVIARVPNPLPRLPETK